MFSSLRPSYVLAGTMVIFGTFSVAVAGAKNATSLIMYVWYHILKFQ
jgi:hypothetical protein